MDELQSAVINFSRRKVNGKLIAEYIWLGGNDLDIRSKCMTLPVDVDQTALPEWNYDGSSTNQALGHDSEVLIRPRKVYPDPFRLGNHILVFCDTWYPDGTPTKSNFRQLAEKVLGQVQDHEPWFSVEQECIFYRKSTNWPLGFPIGGYAKPQGLYYCGIGADVSLGRSIMESHYRACIHAGLKISGINAEVMLGQWEFQMGPCQGIDIGDQLWVARYLLLRCAEMFGVNVNWDPKPLISNDWNGSGGLLNYSTKETREDGGYEVILDYIKKLEGSHDQIIPICGLNAKRRLTGKNESSDWRTFTYGVADRMASVRIPRITHTNQKGYIEDRRPASNMDPYVMSTAIADITLLEGSHMEELRAFYDIYQENLKIGV